MILTVQKSLGLGAIITLLLGDGCATNLTKVSPPAVSQPETSFSVSSSASNIQFPQEFTSQEADLYTFLSQHGVIITNEDYGSIRYYAQNPLLTQKLSGAVAQEFLSFSRTYGSLETV